MTIKDDLKWSDKYLIGVDIIDKQHQRLFEYFDEIEEAIGRQDREKVTEVCAGVVEYAISHNVFEESLLREIGYPEVEQHHSAHEAFRERVTRFLVDLEKGGDPFAIAQAVRVEIGLWLINHIKQEDQYYVPYVKRYKRFDKWRRLFGLRPRWQY